MSQAKVDDFRSLLAEELVRLYLRLNGYLILGGYLLHSPTGQGQGLRTEIDALAVRFPCQREPLRDGQSREQVNDPALVLPKEAGLIDFVVVEVKTGKKQPRFNDPLVKRDGDSLQNLRDILNMLGCFDSEDEISEAADRLLAQLKQPSSTEPSFYDLKNRQARIRFLLFWDQPADTPSERFSIRLSHVLQKIGDRTEPGASCAEYSREHAKWRGVARHILGAMDAIRSEKTICRDSDLRNLEERVLHELGNEAVALL